MNFLSADWYTAYCFYEAQAAQASGAYDQYGIVRVRVRENCLRGKCWVPQKEGKKQQSDGLSEAGKKWVRDGD